MKKHLIAVVIISPKGQWTNINPFTPLIFHHTARPFQFSSPPSPMPHTLIPSPCDVTWRVFFPRLMAPVQQGSVVCILNKKVRLVKVSGLHPSKQGVANLLDCLPGACGWVVVLVIDLEVVLVIKDFVLLCFFISIFVWGLCFTMCSITRFEVSFALGMFGYHYDPYENGREVIVTGCHCWSYK